MDSYKIIITLLGALGVFLISLTVIFCAQFGKNPAGSELEKIKMSKNFDRENGIFINQRSQAVAEMKERMDLWGIFKEWFSAEEGEPENYLPQEKPDFAQFLSDTSGIKAIWLGHSTILLRMDGKTILFDPVFSKYASPIPFMVRRFQPPVVKLEELPEIDFIVISHDHYDHLDMNTVQFFTDKKAEFLVPLGVGSHLRSWDIPAGRITEMDWWEEKKIGSLKFVTTPAQHFSGRGLSDRNKTLWASWVIGNGEKRIYFSGDSGYGPHFKQIGDKYGPFEAVFIESGQYNERWAEVHLLPEHFATVYRELQGKRYIPIHWGMFKLSVHPWYEPIDKLSVELRSGKINLMTPKIGQVFSIDGKLSESFSWKTFYERKRTMENRKGFFKKIEM